MTCCYFTIDIPYSTLSIPQQRPIFSKDLLGTDKDNFYFPKFYNFILLKIDNELQFQSNLFVIFVRI